MTDKSWAEENLPRPETIEQAIRERNGWCDTAAQHLRNEEYYRGLVVKIGKMLGPAAYVSDDGSVQDDVLCAKVPDLVATEIARLRAALAEIAEGKGRFSQDHFQHAKNTIEDMKALAESALSDESRK